MRASLDYYTGDTNFSCLPDLPTSNIDSIMSQKTVFTKLEKLNEISSNMTYDEKVQVELFQERKLKAFRGPLTHFNRKTKRENANKKLAREDPDWGPGRFVQRSS